MAASSAVPLAIVGIGCRLPGDATTPEKLWDLLASGTSAWSPVPTDRWNEDAFHHPHTDDHNGTHNHRGGHFLRQDVGAFDAGFFGLNPQEATAMDPQQRLLLEITYEALESAGIPQERIRGSNASVHMAMFTRDYDRNIYKDMQSIPKYHVTGTGEAILANRISHIFDLHGPSMTLDTGCSGGMTAVYQACQSLRTGATDLALAGAANLILSPDHMISMSNLHMLSADGKSYSFDHRGAGYGRGEGIATLVIKRLDDAIAARDPIRAVIREALINQDGHTAGITLPSGAAQAALEKQAWRNIGLDPKEAGYVEAHGTGTAAGDQAELEGISSVFCSNRDTPLFVGSLKSNIGHLESVSGLAALIKAAMILERNAIPPNVNFQKPKDGLNLEQKRIRIPQALESWTQSGTPRISVNSFGYGGTNAHAILERPPRPHGDHAASLKTTPRLFLLSAKNQPSLLNSLASTQEWISGNSNTTALRDLRYTLSQRRSLLQWRFSCVASTPEELVEELAKGSKPDGTTRAGSNLLLNFVFTGQGAQWAGMGRELLSVPAFSNSMRRSSQILRNLGASWDLIEELLHTDDSSRLKDAELAQPATTAVQMALVDLMQSVGLVPDAVVGHSSGEIGAAYAAGFLDQRTALKASYFRGFSAGIAKRKGSGRGAMLAVGLGEDDVAPYLPKLLHGKAVVACQNSPSSSTVSGDDVAISELSELLKLESVFNRRLQVDTAYHSHHMQIAADDYKHSLGRLRVDDSPKSTKFFSSVTGQQEHDGFDAGYWTSNLVSKVRFCDAFQQLCLIDQKSQAHQIFVEIGPHSALAGPARQCLSDLPAQVPYDYNSALFRGTGALQSFLTMIGKLFERGYQMDKDAISALDQENEDAVVLHGLPTYSWDHSKRHWHQSRMSQDYLMRKYAYHDLLGLRMTENSPLQPVWRHLISIDSLPWLADHVVDGLVIFPGAGYLCMAMEAASQTAAERFSEKSIETLILRDVHFLKGLVLPEGPERIEMQMSFQPLQDEGLKGRSIQYQFAITTLKEEEQWAEHCRGTIIVEFTVSDGYSALDFDSPEELVSAIDLDAANKISSKELYGQLEAVGNYYGPTFAGITQFTADNNCAISNVTIPDIAATMPANHMRPHIIHPSTLDILLHSSLPLVNSKLGASSVMPVHINEIAISPKIESLAGSKLTASTSLTSAAFRTAEADILVFAGSEVGQDAPVMSVLTMELRSLGTKVSSSSAESGGRDLCYELKWGRDADFLSSHQLQVSESLPCPREKLQIMDKATGIYIRRCIEKIHSCGLHIPEEYHRLLFKWMEIAEPIADNLADEMDDQILELVPQQGVEGEFLNRLGTALTGILTGATSALQLMLEDNLLYRVYADDSSARCYSLMSQYMKHKSFKQSELSIVEIGGGTGGATLPFLQALNEANARPSVYDFTDVSAGFFEKARDKLQDWSESVNYRPLDIEKEPAQQGFDPHSYDMVLACNVLHATESIAATLARVRSLLKPDGVLLLIEVTNPQRYLNITFGTLPGWWKGAKEGRDTGPFLSADGWATTMVQNSLEMQLATQDDKLSPVSSFMVAKAVDESLHRSQPRIRLIAGMDLPKCLTTFAIQISKELREQNLVAYRSIWSDNMPYENVVNVVIDNGAKPMLQHVGPDRFRQVSGLLKKPAKVVWITAQDNDSDAMDPRKHLITGLARTAHAENENLQLVTIDVQQGLCERGDACLLKDLTSIIRRASASEHMAEREYAYNGTDIVVPRVIPSNSLNRWISDASDEPEIEPVVFQSSSRPLNLNKRSKDFRTRPTFVDDEAHRVQLGNDEVDIDAKAFGVPSQSSNFSVTECAGNVIAIGREVQEFKVGDRVVAFGKAAFASRPRVSKEQVQHLPECISFHTAAALPISFMTVLHALRELAKTQPGDFVLIDGASNEVGQAATLMAKHLGANAIAAVADRNEARFLTEQLQLPSSHVIPRKGFACKRRLRSLSGSQGIDVIISCSGLQLPSEIEQSLKPFGSMVRLGSSANLGSHGGSLPSSAIIASFDLETLIQARPGSAQELFAQTLDIIRQSPSLTSTYGITAKALQQLDEALRLSQKPEHKDKIVIDVQGNTTVQAIEPTRGDLKLYPDATYIVSGGLGDLGKRYLRIMAKAGAKHLVTLSRSGADPVAHEKFQKELENLQPGCKLQSVKCNIASLDDVYAALDAIKMYGFPIVKGVVQAAVVLNDSTLDTMTAPVFNSVLDTKLDGTLNLDEVFSSEGLDFFISLSSAVGIIGTSGQANYNAGNNFQDALAQFNTDPSCHYMSLNIGTIEGADATINNSVRIQALARQGLTPIEPEELQAFFEYSMSVEARASGCRQAVIGFTPESLASTSAANGAAHTRMFTHVRETEKAKIVSDEVVQKKTFRDIITEESDPDKISDFVATSVLEKLGVLIGINAFEIDPSSSISELGLDSLIAIELRNWIMREFDAPIQSSEIMDNQSLVVLAKKIALRSRLAASAKAVATIKPTGIAGSRTGSGSVSTSRSASTSLSSGSSGSSRSTSNSNRPSEAEDVSTQPTLVSPLEERLHGLPTPSWDSKLEDVPLERSPTDNVPPYRDTMEWVSMQTS